MQIGIGNSIRLSTHMFLALFISVSAFANGPNGDVTTTRIVPGSRQAVAAHLRSTTAIASLLPSCTTEWTHGASDVGPARVTYKILAFKRRLSATLVEVDPNHVFDLDHVGPKGFITRFVLTEVSPTTTKVELTTFLNPPGWPFRSYFFDKVHPLWITCYEEALTTLGKKL